MSNAKKGFTLVEIMIVTICTALLMGPIFFILKSSSNTSLSGMLRIDTTMEARRILKQIHADLKQACCEIKTIAQLESSGKSAFPSAFFVSNGATPPGEVYLFDTFSNHGSIDDSIIKRNVAKQSFRRPAQVVYKLEAHADSKKPSYKLVRIETMNSKVRKTILSNRVNYFTIEPEVIQTGTGESQGFFRVTLQLVDALHEKDFKGKGLNAGDRVNKLQSKIILADFFDLVSPDYYNSIHSQLGMVANQHTLVQIK